MNEIEYERLMENAAIGSFLVEAVATYFGCNATVDDIKRAVYKSTDCGAWIAFTETGIELGSIVEGSNADVITDPLIYADQTEEQIHQWLTQTLEYVEAEADILWHEANF